MKQNELISKKHKKVCKILCYTEYLTYFSVYSAVIKKSKSIIKKKKKKSDKTVLLPKNKSNTVEVLISKALSDSFISHHEFVLVNNILREYDVWKKKLKVLKLNRRFWSIYLFIYLLIYLCICLFKV